MDNIYNELAAKIYNYWYPEPDGEELNFYEKYIKEANGVCLEAACGNGRLMIPYLKMGFDVEGFDASEPMLKLAREAAERAGMQIKLYNQAMEKLDIGKKYKAIYAPFGALHHVKSTQALVKALQKFYEHTEQGGYLIIHLLQPFAENLHQEDWSLNHTAIRREDGAKILTYGKNNYDKVTQVLTSDYKVEIKNNERILERGEWKDSLQLYTESQMQGLLETVGYKIKEIHKSFNPLKNSDTGILILVAIK